MHVVLIGGQQQSLLNFRGSLMTALIKNGHEVTAAAGESNCNLTNELRLLGVQFIDLPINRAALSPLADFLLVLKIVNLLRQKNPDILIVYTLKAVIFGCIASKLFKKMKVYPMITGLGYSLIDKKGLKALWLKRLILLLYRFSLTHVRTVFFQNNDDIAYFQKNRLLNVDSAFHRVMGSGVDLEKFKQIEIPKGAPKFLMIARLLKEKGVEEFVHASKAVKRQYPEAQFWIVGDIDRNPSSVSKEWLEEWKNEGSVIFFGAVADVRPYLSKCSVFVLPSYREGLPRSTLEAMATGRAVITTDVPGCRDTVKHGVNGFLIPKESSKDLVIAMTRFIVGDSDVSIMGSESRRMAELFFDVHKVNDQIMKRLSN